MEEKHERGLSRRQLITQAVPACAMVCLGSLRIPKLLGQSALPGQEVHKFEVRREMNLSQRDLWYRDWGKFVDLLRTLQGELAEREVLRLLDASSTAWGQRMGEQQARNSPDRTFESFKAQFRPPRFATVLTHEVVEDTDEVLELCVTECIHATCFQEVRLDGEIGHACVCNMDYSWPIAFNPDFRMERSKTLMEGDDCCNHRYINTAARGPSD